MKICVASGQSADHETITESLRHLPGTVDVGKFIYSGDNLLQIVASDRTEVLILDVNLSGTNIFHTISKIRESKFLQVILIAPEKTYSYAYTAMKLQACELLIRPFDTEQLLAALTCAAKHLQTDYCFLSPHQKELSRRSFAEQLNVILDGQKTARDINTIYNTTLQNGLYQVVTFSVDFSSIDQIPQLAEQLCTSLIHFLEEKLANHIFDIVYSRIYNEIRIILNYPASSEEKIASVLPSLFLYAESLCSSSPGLEVFMGIGNSYDNINKLPQSCEESKNGIWQRMFSNAPRNKMGYQHLEIHVLPDEYKQQIFVLEQHIRTSIENLNIEDFTKYVNDYFSLPEDILYLPETRKSILSPVKYFCDLYKEKIDLFDHSDTYYYSIKMLLLSSRNIREFKTKYIRSFTEMFQHFLADSDNTTTKNISQAIAYIARHYMEDLSLEAVAAQVDLNPSYFSRRFKAETGQTFTAYLLTKRMTVARMLLAKTNYRINEVSSAVGYPDQRYFSQLFMKHVGMTPSMYRKVQDL